MQRAWGRREHAEKESSQGGCSGRMELGQASARLRSFSFPKGSGEPLKGFQEGGAVIRFVFQEAHCKAAVPRADVKGGEGEHGKAS